MFLANAGTYCVQANCAFGLSNVSFVEPSTGISDFVFARVDFFSVNFDQITITMGSDAGGDGGGDAGEGGDITNILFTTHPVGFTVVALSDVPEPSSLCLLALGLSGVVTRRIVKHG